MAQFYEIVGHEAIYHGLLDTNKKGIEGLIKKIESNKELSEVFHSADNELEELYGSNT